MVWFDAWNLKIFGEGWKMSKMVLRKLVESIVFEVSKDSFTKSQLNVPSFGLTALGRNVIRFHLSPSLKTGFPNHFGILLKIRHRTIVFIASYVAYLIGFSKFQQFVGHNCIFGKSRGTNWKKHPEKSFGAATIGDLALLLHKSFVMV